MKILYRPDIDALRGLAVISVLIYHAKFLYDGSNIFSGGFLGVDIFFVLTGFLITTLLISEIKKNKKIDIINFYLRRIRRLVPTLLVVIILATFFSYFLLDPTKLKEFSASVLFSLSFLANIYFHYFGNFYGNDINAFKPLLHLWSLGIEEQFYIIYPFFLIIFFKYFKKNFLFFLSCGFILSLLFAEYASIYNKQFSFYMLPSRAWEIILGSILAIIILNKKKDVGLSISIKNILYFLCLIIISTSFFLFDVSFTKHPSSITLIPLLAVAMIIILGNDKKKCNFFYFFSNKILIYFGKISYSLYLFHFIIFAFFRNSYLEESIFSKLIIIIISIYLSSISYKYIEQFFRNKSMSPKKMFSFIFLLAGIIISINIYFIFDKRLLHKQYQIDGINLTQWHDTEKMISEVTKYNLNNFPKNNKINVLIVGNCHADDTFLALILNKEKFKNYNFILQKRVDINFFKKNSYKDNSLYNNADIILLSTQWSESDQNNLEHINEWTKKDNKKLILLSNIPEFSYEEIKFKFRKIKITNYKRTILSLGSSTIPSKDISILEKKYYNDYYNNQKIIKTNAALKKFALMHNLKYVDLVKLICNDHKKICKFRLEDSKDELFRDYGRYSYNSLNYFGEKFHQLDFLD
jgi:peptidoglycan/LPS O-acetylase OafA/YrhL